MKTTRLRCPRRGASKNAILPLLALLLSSTAAPLTNAGAVADDSLKRTRKIPLVGGILDKVKNAMSHTQGTTEEVDATEGGVASEKNDETPEADEDVVDEEEDAAATGNEPVCKSDAAGVMNCVEGGPKKNPSESATITAGGDVTENGGGPPEENSFKCEDLHEECSTWSNYRTHSSYGDVGSGGACGMNSAYMTHYCPASCGTCDLVRLGYRLSRALEGGLAVIPFCQDNDFSCRAYAEAGECEKNPEYMSAFCEASCGVCSEESNKFGVGQRLHKDDPAKKKMTMERLAKSVEYMMGTVKRDRKYSGVREACLNKVPDCTLWASRGECDVNPDYMNVMCAPACTSCDLLGDTSETCPGLPETAGPLWKPGDLNRFFENVVDDADGKGGYLKYNPEALSRPGRRGDGKPAPIGAEDGPWVVLLENFITDEEADRIVDVGRNRTRCREPSCARDPLVSPVLERIATATGSTTNHSEPLRVLRYEEGESGGRRHDFVPRQLDAPCGARIVTLFLYLNDVEEGGGTGFPVIGVSVKPRKGSAILWPSVRDEDPMEKDPRTEHEAEPVRKGVKYGAFAWIHSEDFQTPSDMGCM